MLEFGKEAANKNWRRALATALVITASTHLGVITLSNTAYAQAAQTTVYSVPAGSLSQALMTFGRQSGLQVTYLAAVASGKRSPGFSGTATREQAIARILSGSGLSYSFPNSSTVAISGSAAGNLNATNVDGAIQLDPVDVSGAGVSAIDAPYQTPGAVSYISQETIDRFRGSSPADIFRGTPGVLSGEPRNGGGGIDVNIRGMQGMGRVAVTIDGAENGLSVYQGYQGISNRTFVDPDLLAGVDIRKGSDASSRGIAGTVAMRTLSADDIVKQGEKWGVWVKSGFGTNTATPKPGDHGGYTWPVSQYATAPNPVPTAQASGLDRPGLLDPTSGSFSTVAAIKEDNYDLLWGYAFRKQGNYFAGKNGPGAGVYDAGPRPFCYSPTNCSNPPNPLAYDHYYQNTGLSSYRAGEQVLNTQLETESYLAKATVRDDNGQSLQLGYTGYRSKAGDVVASLFASPQSQAIQQVQEDTTNLNTGTARYRWKPEDNGLVDLKANFWITSLSLRTPPRVSLGSVPPETFGLPYNYLPGNDSTMLGGDVSNKSHFSLDRFGSLDLDYGMSYINEATKPIPFTNELNLGIPARDGTREEVAGFGKAAYKPVEWLTLNGGLRYSHYRSEDRSVISNATQVNPQPSREDGGYSPSAGVVLEPVKGTQFYANYSSALRMPTLFESVAAYSLIPNPNIHPERSNNWEAGVNVIKDGVLTSKDKAMFKFGYFNWDVKDYVARVGITGVDPTTGYPYSGLQVQNIDRARFEGLEFSGRYENSGFTADLAANYYLNVEFCPTASMCSGSTLSGDYATNQVPPQYSANLTVSQKLLDDALTVGGRVSYTGPRSVGHGAVQYGAAAIIAPIDWEPYWLFDAFTEYKLTNDITLWATMENLTDQYYVDPLSLVQQPGPGRTVRLGMTGKFGGSERISPISFANLFAPSGRTTDWTGFHAGVNSAYNFAEFSGTANALDGTPTGYSATEAPNQRIRAFSYGLQVGYDYQFSNRIVAGIEADIAKSEIGGSQATYANEGSAGQNSNNLFRQRQFEAVQKTGIDWLSTVRGRLGYAFNDKLMLYATGGAAFMRQNEERTQYLAVPNGANAPTATAAAFTEKASLTRVGYALGAGAEYKIGGGWSVKGEFLFARFGQEDIHFANARAGVMPDVTTYTTTVIDPGRPRTYDPTPAGCVPQPTYRAHPECYLPAIPETTQTTATTTQGSGSKSIGRKILSAIDIPMIKVGVSYQF